MISGSVPARESSGKGRKVHVTGSFLRSSTEMQALANNHTQKFKAFLTSYYLANFMGVVVLVDAYATCVDIDARAKDPNGSAPEFFLTVSDVCLVLYSLEILALILVVGRAFFQDWVTLLDAGIVACGWAEKVIASLGNGLGFRVAVLRALRLVRIFRLMRVLKRIRPLRELHKLVMMMATCFRTLLWSFLLCFVVMTVWAMLMVEMIYPALEEMYRDRGTFGDCEQCRRAMSSVMDANLLLFKTVIAGDSWGEIAVPVIQEHPETAVIFVGSLLTLVFGVLNIIVAVVVDTFADARQNDLQNLAEEMEDEIEHDRRALAKLFAKIDKDNSGQLTLQELIEGARVDATFQSRLRVMDIDENDLQQLFQMIDLDQSGTIEVAEFIGPLSRWAHDSKTAPRFIKYNMLQTMHLQEDLYDLSVDCFRQLSMRVDELAHQISTLTMLNHSHSLNGSGGAHGHRIPPDSGQESLNHSSSLGLWTRQNTAQEQSPTQSKTTSQEQIDQPRASVDAELFYPRSEKETPETGETRDAYLENLLESSVTKLEAKLDLLLERSRTKAPGPIPDVGLGSGGMDSWKAEAGLQSSGLRSRKKPKMLHPEAFRSMYMNRGRRISLLDSPPSEDGAKHHTAQRAEARQSRRISATDVLCPDPMTNPSVREDPTFIGTRRSSHPKQEIARDL